MRLVYTHDNMSIVHSTKNILEINGIECLLKNEHGSTMGPEFGVSNAIEVWVLNPDAYDEALALIENSVTNAIDKSAWLCGECNEENEGNFAICWQCQSGGPDA